MDKFSLIICSRTSDLSENFKVNIEETIGVSFELISIDNSRSQYSIFEAYNKGLKKCTGDIICFLHDDIFFRTNNWGSIIKKHFLGDSQVGLIGVAGGKVKSKMPSAWWDAGRNSMRVIQHYNNGTQGEWKEGFKRGVEEVVAVDGFFMVMRADSRIKFDERLSGFHNYDLWLSLTILQLGKKIIVIDEILIEHLSEGKLDKSWYSSTSKFHKLYRDHLPITVLPDLDKDEIDRIEFMVGTRFVNGLISMGLKRLAFIWWLKTIKIKPQTKIHLRILKRILLEKPQLKLK